MSGFRFPLLLLSLVICALSISFSARAESARLSDYPNCPKYISSTALEANNAKLIQIEEGEFLSVPLNYSDPSRGSTRIYYHFAQKYQPERPTLALFTGGPGQHSHLQSSNQMRFFGKLGFNFLLFDQRGLGLSRMETEDEARDARSFSSENSARDLKSILDHLQINQVSVYGVSYGTVPATIFGHLFPDRTKTVLLEGVVFDGWMNTMKSRNLAKQIEHSFQKLPPDLQQQILDLMNEKKLSESWYPALMSRLLMAEGLVSQKEFQKQLQKHLKAGKFQNESQLTQVIEMEMSFATTDQKSTTESERARAWAQLERGTGPCTSIANSTDLNHLLMLKEFDANHSQATLTLALRNGKVEPIEGKNYSSHLLKFENLDFSSYSAARYPLKVPVVYFQGTADSATPSPGAARHFRESSKAAAQLIYFKQRAHLPLHQLIATTGTAHPEWLNFKKVIVKLIRGEPFDCDSVEALRHLDSKLELAIAQRSRDGAVKALHCQSSPAVN